MSIKLRFALLLGFLLVGFLAVLWALHWSEAKQAENMLGDVRRDRVAVLDHWLDASTRSLQEVAADYAQTEELAKFAARPDAAWATANFQAILTHSGLQALWIVRADGTLIQGAHLSGEEQLETTPLAPKDFARVVASTPSPHFFAEKGDDLFEICASPIPASAEHPLGTPIGWLVVARQWDTAQLRTLASLTESATALSAPGEEPPVSPGKGVTLTRSLPDWQGHTLRLLHVHDQAREAGFMLQTDAFQARLFVVFGLLIITALWFSLQNWVLRPLGWIGRSLALGDPAPIRALCAQTHELGRIACLIESAFEQRDALRRSEGALRRMLDERAALGRDLHDGVIQSLYAAGMGLAGIHALLRSDQGEVSARLEQTRAALNDTIGDVRNFITGLEPEALRQRSFGQAVASLLEFMQSIRPARIAHEIDESLAARLTLEQRAHALQIAREAVSNALRHGE
ncbi:MAG: hypothetical protein KGJ37_01765, partial [Verrucomicrobiota bacterium]|nr:hypothetical protein [Verrucomicrobiota bacterium]